VCCWVALMPLPAAVNMQQQQPRAHGLALSCVLRPLGSRNTHAHAPPGRHAQARPERTAAAAGHCRRYSRRPARQYTRAQQWHGQREQRQQQQQQQQHRALEPRQLPAAGAQAGSDSHGGAHTPARNNRCGVWRVACGVWCVAWDACVAAAGAHRWLLCHTARGTPVG
jgi:hypothetical protein